METDRNLLFAALALELKYVSQEQLAEACAEWIRRIKMEAREGEAPAEPAWQEPRPPALADVFIERGWLTSGLRNELERAVEQRLGESLGDVRRALAATADDRLRDAISRVEHEEFRRTLSRLPPAGIVPVETIDLPSDSHSRYTLTRLHSEGGLGRIWLARDTVLGREIALKEVRPDKDSGPAAWQRFVLEAQITGQLEHPNIVPVYELSGPSQGESAFYTMRFLRGQTLNDAIADYHERRRKGRAERIELTRLLNAFVAVCNAVAFAHARGVVHRDLKPSNVMLGAFGEVVVIDWGLAKVLGRRDDIDEPQVQVTGITPDLATQAGQVVGTVAYMAPEQADGRLEMVDARTDVYCLGGILYAILTGRHPHTGLDTDAMLERISAGDAPRVRGADSSAPAALDAVCAKAMSRRRSHRYQTATELAHDVQRWLADEPVSVYRDPVSVRLLRWMRRHRAWAASTAAALVLVAAAALVAAILINRARENEAVARLQAQRSLIAEQKARAEALRRLKEQRRVMERSLFVATGEAMASLPGMREVIEPLLKEAAQDYARLAEETSDDPELQADTGRALISLSNVRRLLEEWEESEKASRRAVARFKSLVRDDPDHTAFELERLKAQAGQAIALGALGRNDDSERLYDETLRGFDGLVKRASEDPEYRFQRSVARLNRAPLLMSTSRLKEARSLLEQAEAEFHELVAMYQSNESPKCLEGLGLAQMTLGEVMRLDGANEYAVRKLTTAVETFERLAAADPDSPAYLESLAKARLTLANALRTLGDDQYQVAIYEAATGDYATLVQARPGIPAYHETLAVTRIDLAQVLHALGRNREARAQLEEAVQTLLNLLDSDRFKRRYRDEIGAAMTALGRVLAELNLDPEAETHLDQAIQISEALLGDAGEVPDYLRSRGAARAARAELSHQQGRHDAALEVYQAAISDYQQALQADADDVWGRDGLAWCQFNYGELLYELERFDEAKAAYRSGLSVRKKLIIDPVHRYHLAWFLVVCRDPELCDFNRAITLTEALTNSVPQSSRFWTLLGAARYRAGRWAEGETALRKAENLQTHPDGLTQLFLAMAYWRCGEKDAARQAVERGIGAIEEDRPGNRLLKRLRIEAAELLEIDSSLQCPAADGASAK